MHKVLVDTQIFLWWLTDDARLSKKLRMVITAPRQTVFVSIISLWEIVIKESIGKLKLPRTFDFQKAIKQYHFVLLPITPAHLERLRRLPLKHKDPFDRLLVSQAQEEEATLVTTDEQIKKYMV